MNRRLTQAEQEKLDRITKLPTDLKTVYVALDPAQPGDERPRVAYASWSQHGLMNLARSDEKMLRRDFTTLVVDVKATRAAAMAKLDGMDRLVLRIDGDEE